MVREVWFFGDAPPTWLEPVIVFEEGDALVICDFTECGLYIASKYMRRGYRWREERLVDALEGLDPSTPVRAYNNGKALWMRRMEVETVGDLIRALRAAREWILRA